MFAELNSDIISQKSYIIMLSVIMLSVVMPSAVVPLKGENSNLAK
jgi:hypothetical protein